MTTAKVAARKRPRSKPAKPYPDFPLFAHDSGQWAKKIRRRMYYFGVWSDPDAALANYRRERDDLYAGRTPRPAPLAGDLTIRELCNRFYTSKKLLLDAGEISGRTLNDYRGITDVIVEVFGRERVVEQLTPDDFQRLRSRFAKTRGPVGLGNAVTMVRTVFNYAVENQLIPRAVNYGSEFKKPSKKVLRKHRAARGPLLFTPEEVRTILDEVDCPVLKAAILLGLNVGFGNHDVATLPESAVDLETGWVTYPRPKTGQPRRAKLWSETVDAIKAAMAVRPAPADPADAGLVCLTTEGNRLVRLNPNGRKSWVDAINLKFGRLLKRKRLNLKRPGVNFYTCRRTFRTIADAAGDQRAANTIMGHVPPADDMPSVYVQAVDDDRLEKVAQHVHSRLFGE